MKAFHLGPNLDFIHFKENNVLRITLKQNIKLKASPAYATAVPYDGL